MFTINFRGKLVEFVKPAVMGIINATPDSFYEGSRVSGTEHILEQATAMLAAGADIIDIGGQSTRPGSDVISPEEELERVIPGIEAIRNRFPEALISIDTYYGKVAEEAVKAGASMVNDVSAGMMDEKMIATVAALGVPYCAMHMKGTPQTMNKMAEYDNIITEVLDFLSRRVDECRRAGIKDVIIDPGFGFAKQSEHNFRLLAGLHAMKIIGCPLLVGLSRKSMVYKTLGTTPAEALNGTTALHMLALLQGADILRVHDVKEAREAITLFEEYKKTASNDGGGLK